MGQEDAASGGLDQPDEPFVTGGGFDDGLEFSEIFKEAADGLLVGTEQSRAFNELPGWVHDADGDSLFVQVAAGVKHGVLLVVETEIQHHTFTTLPSTPPAGSACS
jgi:hypothetical protein